MWSKRLSNGLNTLWYESRFLGWFLWPLAMLYRVFSAVRRVILTYGFQVKSTVPVVVVGNLTTGGVGKTPLVIALATRWQKQGIRVGIVSRGYGACAQTFPCEVTVASNAQQVGDEPLLIAQSTGCPVVIAPQRAEAIDYLIKNHQVQVILSDDGLQHYRMGRQVEIAVIDGVRGLGNGLCLPAGPLREPSKRLKQVDFIVVNGGVWEDGYRMDLVPGKVARVKDGEHVDANTLKQPIAAVAAIGNPSRFFQTLSALGIVFTPYPFPDHHQFCASELNLVEPTVLMTAKDAVKCHAFAKENLFYLPVEAKMTVQFWEHLHAHPKLREVLS